MARKKTVSKKLTQAQRTALGNIIARGGVSEHDLHMGRMGAGDVRKSVAHKLVQMGLVRVEPLWTDVRYGRTRLLPAERLHQRVDHYYATAAGLEAYGHDEPARIQHAVKKGPAQLEREIAEALARPLKTFQDPRSSRKVGHASVGHSTKKLESSTSGRWIHRAVARSHDVPEDVVRRIYGAVQIAKRQGLHGGYAVDLIERSVGRKLVGHEYTVASRAKEHLSYDPPSGYGGPKPTGSAKEPPRAKYGEKVEGASQMASRADRIIKDVLRRREQWSRGGWDEKKDRDLLRQAADELDVAADLYEEAGANIRAGTLHERARQARHGDYDLLAAYE